MKKNLLAKIQLVIFGLVLAIGASYASAQWSDPTGTPPSNNTDVPIHAGTADQVKQGGLSVNTFIAAMNAQFDQNVFLQGIVRGGTPSDTNSTVYFGGTSGSTTYNVSTVVNGGIQAANYLRSGQLANASNSEVCADSQGNLILCGTANPVLEPEAGCMWQSGIKLGGAQPAVQPATEGYIMYSLQNIDPSRYKITWESNASSQRAIAEAMTCNSGALDNVACVMYFSETGGSRFGISVSPPPGYDFQTSDVQVSIEERATGTRIGTVSATNLANLPAAFSICQ